MSILQTPVHMVQALFVREVDDKDLRGAWNKFEEGLKNESRYFSKVCETLLDGIFGALANQIGSDGQAVIVEVGPEQSIKEFYRGRVFQSDDALIGALQAPEIELGPPSSRQATAGRMNPHGISAFYGATDEETVLSEVRPPVGSRVLMGRFEVTRNIQLLDISALKKIIVESGSWFDSAYINKLRRAKFLHRLSQRISKPILPDDQPLDFLVTQVIADYLANVAYPSLDGVIYPSSQNVGVGTNVVLFHKASRVAPRDSSRASPKAFLKTGALSWEYSVHEHFVEKSDPGPFDWAGFYGPRDWRPETLRLHPLSLQVHEVAAVKFEATSHTVRKYLSRDGEQFSFPLN